MKGIFLFLLVVTMHIYATDSNKFKVLKQQILNQNLEYEEKNGGIFVKYQKDSKMVKSSEKGKSHKVNDNQQGKSPNKNKKDASPGKQSWYSYLQGMLNNIRKKSSSSVEQNQREESFDEEEDENEDENIEEEKGKEELKAAVAKIKSLKEDFEKTPTKKGARKITQGIQKIEEDFPEQLKKKKKNSEGKKNFETIKDEFASFYKQLAPVWTNKKQSQKKENNAKSGKKEEEEDEEEDQEGENEEEDDNEGQEDEEGEDEGKKDDDICEEEESTNKDKQELKDQIKLIEEDMKNEKYQNAATRIKETDKKYEKELKKQKEENPKGKSQLDDLKEKFATSNPKIFKSLFLETDENKKKKDETSNKSLKVNDHASQKKKSEKSEVLPWWAWVLIAVGILMLLLSPIVFYYECCYSGARDDYRDESIPDFELNINVDHSRFRTDGTTFLAEELNRASNDMNQITCMNKEFAKFLKMDDEPTQKASISEIELVSTILEKNEGDMKKTCKDIPAINNIQELENRNETDLEVDETKNAVSL